MAKDFLSQRLRAEADRIIDKQRITEKVHEHFSRFGNKVVNTILHYAHKETGLRTLCNKLRIKPSYESDKIYKAIVEMIASGGEQKFLSLVAERSAKQAFEEFNDPIPPEYLQWPYVERRSGEERRSGKDRRAKCDIVFKNNRFGNDRRSGKERRKNWPPKQGPLSLTPLPAEIQKRLKNK